MPNRHLLVLALTLAITGCGTAATPLVAPQATAVPAAAQAPGYEVQSLGSLIKKAASKAKKAIGSGVRSGTSALEGAAAEAGECGYDLGTGQDHDTSNDGWCENQTKF